MNSCWFCVDFLNNIKYFGVNNNYSGGVNSSCKNYEVFWMKVWIICSFVEI